MKLGYRSEIERDGSHLAICYQKVPHNGVREHLTLFKNEFQHEIIQMNQKLCELIIF